MLIGVLGFSLAESRLIFVVAVHLLTHSVTQKLGRSSSRMGKALIIVIAFLFKGCQPTCRIVTHALLMVGCFDGGEGVPSALF